MTGPLLFDSDDDHLVNLLLVRTWSRAVMLVLLQEVVAQALSVALTGGPCVGIVLRHGFASSIRMRQIALMNICCLRQERTGRYLPATC